MKNLMELSICDRLMREQAYARNKPIDVKNCKHNKFRVPGVIMNDEIITEWFFLQINERLRVSVLIHVIDGMTDEEKETFARFQYMRMTFQDVTGAAA